MKYLESIGYAKPLPDGNWDLNFIVLLAEIAKRLELCSANLDERKTDSD